MTISYRVLGGTGIQVSTYCLGTMMFGSVGGSGAGNPDHDECATMTHAALDAGINFIDTADMYSAGESEQILGAALRGRRDEVVLASKFHFPLGDGPHDGGNSRRYLYQALEASLRRLQTDWLDLYQVHRPDESTDIEETLAALTDLQREGKIRAFGTSTFPAHHLVEAHAVSERRGLGRFRSEQPPYSLLARGIERDVLPTCQRLGMGVLTWSPLAFGFLSGKYRRDAPTDLHSGRAALSPQRFDPNAPGNDVKYAALEQLITLADDLGVALPQLAVAFPLIHPAVTSVIIGPRSVQQLEHTLAGSSLTLDDTTLDRIDSIVPPGADVHQVEPVWTPQSLTDAQLRRRPLSYRPAGLNRA